MSVGVVTFSGERLKEARLARGLFKKTLAEKVGVTGAAIGRYEDGLDNPQIERLRAIAAELNFSEQFFLRPTWLESPNVVFWRSRASETKSAREMTEQRMKWQCEIFNLLEKEVLFPKVDIPKLSIPRDFKLITPDDIESAAIEARAYWGLRDYPIPDVVLALENAGIPVSFLSIPTEKQDGFCFKSNQLERYFVGLNSYNISCVRARYDAAHELGHILLHSNVSKFDLSDIGSFKLIEEQAHRFAGAFLFPRDRFVSEVERFSLDYFCALKRKWGISIAAMIYRAFNLGLIDEYDRSQLYQNMNRRRWRGPRREPYDDLSEMPLEKPRMLKRGIDALVDQGFFSFSLLQSELSLPIEEIEQICGFSRGYFHEKKFNQFTVDVRSKDIDIIDLETGNIIQFPKKYSKTQ